MGKNFYSVPFLYVGRKVRVRLTEKMVEVFDEEARPLAVHSRLEGTARSSTFDAHYPGEKVSVARFEVHHAREQSKRIGPHGEKLIDELLSGEYPLRHLRRVQGILRLMTSHQVSAEALDYACSQALVFNKKRLACVKACERRASEAVAGGLHPLEFLRLVLEDELLSRKDRASKMLVTIGQGRGPERQTR